MRDVRQEGHRWPEYRASIAHHGLLSILAVPVQLDGDTRAAINLYSTTPNAFTREAVSAAEAFADQASTALRLAVRIAYLSDTSDNLKTALESRTVINLAAGIILAQNWCPQDTATRILKPASSTRNIKMHDVAAAVVSSVADGTTHTHFDQCSQWRIIPPVSFRQAHEALMKWLRGTRASGIPAGSNLDSGAAESEAVFDLKPALPKISTCTSCK